MVVVGLRGKPANAAFLIKEFRSRPSAAGLLAGLPNADQYLENYFNPFIAKKRNFLRSELFEPLERSLALRATEAAFAPEYRFDDLQVQLLSVETEFPHGLDVFLPPVGPGKIETHVMRIKAVAKVKLQSPIEARRWKIGFIQTVDRLERKVTFKEGSKLHHGRFWIDGPRKDGPRGYSGVWFDEGFLAGCVRQLEPSDFQTIEVQIRDQPGMSFDIKAGLTMESASGGEAFRTWLALRRKDGQTHFLRMWQWHVDYSVDPFNIPRFGITFDGSQPFADGTGAVLAGPTTKDAINSDWREEDKSSVSFDQLKEAAFQARQGPNF